MDSINLGRLHHVAIQVKDIKEAVEWYETHTDCRVAYVDNTWALLEYSNTSLALVLPDAHPPHIALEVPKASKYGVPKTHRDKTKSVYIEDPNGNILEMLEI